MAEELHVTLGKHHWPRGSQASPWVWCCACTALKPALVFRNLNRDHVLMQQISILVYFNTILQQNIYASLVLLFFKFMYDQLHTGVLYGTVIEAIPGADLNSLKGVRKTKRNKITFIWMIHQTAVGLNSAYNYYKQLLSVKFLSKLKGRFLQTWL